MVHLDSTWSPGEIQVDYACQFGCAPSQKKSTWTPGGLRKITWTSAESTWNMWGKVKSSNHRIHMSLCLFWWKFQPIVLQTLWFARLPKVPSMEHRTDIRKNVIWKSISISCQFPENRKFGEIVEIARKFQVTAANFLEGSKLFNFFLKFPI